MIHNSWIISVAEGWRLHAYLDQCGDELPLVVLAVRPPTATDWWVASNLVASEDLDLEYHAEDLSALVDWIVRTANDLAARV